MKVLGIESTCDETACAVVEEGKKILSSVIAAQIDLHSVYGGVVPELACRRHVDLMIPVLDQALAQASCRLSEMDLIAVAQGPGLVGALLIGINCAQALSLALKKPFIGVNHVEAHLYAALMSHLDRLSFPILGVVLSGGHTTLAVIEKLGIYRLLGQTVDDAIGEAFDKVAKMLGLPYPGGPEIERLAQSGDPFRYPLKAGVVKGRPLDFSFSGLKTAVLYTLKKPGVVDRDLAASFQHTAIRSVVDRVVAAAKQEGTRTVALGGGVTNNQLLRQQLSAAAPHLQFLWPPPGLSLDNAAMIAGLGFHKYRHQGRGDALGLDALTTMPLN